MVSREQEKSLRQEQEMERLKMANGINEQKRMVIT